MASATCEGCGRMTNSAISNYWSTPDRKPTKCKLAIVNGQYEAGCNYNPDSISDVALYGDKIGQQLPQPTAPILDGNNANHE